MLQSDVAILKREKKGNRESPHIIAYKVHPRDQMSVLSSMSAWLGQSHNSGARKGAEQCSDAHSYTQNHNKNSIR